MARGDSFWGVLGIPLDAEPGEEPLRVTFHDADGAEIGDATGACEIFEIERDIEHIILTPETAALRTEESKLREAERRAEQFAQSDPAPAWSGPFRPPGSTVTSQFGVRRSYDGGTVESFHSGVDYGGNEGDPVLAAAPGRVSWTGEMPLRGNSVIIDHGAGVMSGYHHLSGIAVADEDVVAAGDQIGTLGSTGVSTGPHLHWEISIHGVNVEPLDWTFKSFLTSGSFGPPAPTESAQE